MCEHSFVSHRQIRCCVRCGLSQRFLRLDSYSPHASPLGRSYDRFQRFLTKIDRLLGIGSVPKPEDPVWHYLTAQTMRGPGDVRRALRRSGLIHKHYDCVRAFTDAFTSFRCGAVNTLRTKAMLEQKFRFVKVRWGLRDGFFSYDWLIRKFLEEGASPLTAYLKRPTNKKRELKYRHMMRMLQLDVDMLVERRVMRKQKTVNRMSQRAHATTGVDHMRTWISSLRARKRLPRKINREFKGSSAATLDVTTPHHRMFRRHKLVHSLADSGVVKPAPATR